MIPERCGTGQRRESTSREVLLRRADLLNDVHSEERARVGVDEEPIVAGRGHRVPYICDARARCAVVRLEENDVNPPDRIARTSRHDESGFTLLDAIVVALIPSRLVALALPSSLGVCDKAAVDETMS